MKIIHYIPSIDRMAGGTSTYMQVLAKPLGTVAIAESLALGTPVITTHGTPWEDLNETHLGAWIEVGTKPLVETLRHFLSLSTEKLEEMGRNGRKLIEEKYSANVMAQEMINVYNDCLKV